MTDALSMSHSGSLSRSGGANSGDKPSSDPHAASYPSDRSANNAANASMDGLASSQAISRSDFEQVGRGREAGRRAALIASSVRIEDPNPPPPASNDSGRGLDQSNVQRRNPRRRRVIAAGAGGLRKRSPVSPAQPFDAGGRNDLMASAPAQSSPSHSRSSGGHRRSPSADDADLSFYPPRTGEHDDRDPMSGSQAATPRGDEVSAGFGGHSDGDDALGSSAVAGVGSPLAVAIGRDESCSPGPSPAVGDGFGPAPSPPHTPSDFGVASRGPLQRPAAPPTDDALASSTTVRAGEEATAPDHRRDDWDVMVPKLPYPIGAERNRLPDAVRWATPNDRDLIEACRADPDVRAANLAHVTTPCYSVREQLLSHTFEEDCATALDLGMNVVFDQEGATFAIRPGDVLYSVCHVGQSRSQCLHRYFLHVREAMRARGLPLTVTNPHGAESGADPFTRYTDLNGDNYFEYIYCPLGDTSDRNEWGHRAFVAAFGSNRMQRVGDTAENQKWIQDVNVGQDVDAKAAETARQCMHSWFTDNYYKIDPSEVTSRRRRFVFVCFQRGAAIVLSRLLEANRIGGHAYPLEHITLVALPDGDAVPNSGNTNQVGEAMRLYPSYLDSLDDSMSPEEVRTEIRHELCIALHHRFYWRLADRFYVDPEALPISTLDAFASIATTRAEDGSVHVAAHDDVRVLGVMHGLGFDAGGLRNLSAPRLASLRGALEEVLAIVRRQEELVAARDDTGTSL